MKGKMVRQITKGTYDVTVTDNLSCKTSQTFSIFNDTDDCKCFVYVANAFSPNGDNNNDDIPVRGECVNDLSFKIFNRWGNLVFEEKGYLGGWNGSSNINRGVNRLLDNKML